MNNSKILIILINIFIINICFCLEKTTFNIITFNIHGYGKILSGCNGKKNINQIIDEISNYDIIFIQENWKYNNLIIDQLFNHQLIFGNNKKNKISFSSGLVIGINRNFEIINYDEITYNDCNGILLNGSDCFASKGFIFSRIKIDDQILDIYNTHMDAGNSLKDKNIRSKQLISFEKFIIENSTNHNLIICGDFNIDYYNSSQIHQFQNNLDLQVVKWNDNYFLDKKIDYIFYRIMFPYEISTDEIPNILYTLSDHPPLTLSLKAR